MYIHYICGMANYSKLKEELIQYCIDFIDEQINNVQTAINSAKESAQNESKSSAGDKHETGKSLMQLEQENNAQHLNKMLNLKRVVPLLTNYESTGIVGMGSLVDTTQGLYYLSLGIGIVDLPIHKVFVISPTSPIGKMLQGKTIGDEVKFNGKFISIKKIV